MAFTKELYDAIRKDAEVKELVINGRRFTDKPIHPVLAAEPDPVGISTLTGLLDYLAANVDDLNLKSLMVMVKSPSYVELVSDLHSEHCQRSCVMKVSAVLPKTFFEQQLSAEAFNIWLQSGFVDSADRANVLSYAGNVVATADATVMDDGTSQAVTVRSGITSKAVKKLPNPVVLAPYRTFAEVQQPESAFVFRVHDGLKFSLTEADGGAWRNHAMHNISTWLKAQFEAMSIPVTVIA